MTRKLFQLTVCLSVLSYSVCIFASTNMTSDNIQKKLENKHLSLPAVVAPIANYVPYVVSGNMVYISGQLPIENAKVKFVGKVGHDFSTEQGREAAKLCVLNILAQLQAAIGDLNKVKRVVKITGFVNAAADYIEQPKVMNGASDLLVELFGEQGKHARSAVGVQSLPLNAAVEVEAIFEINEAL